MNDVQVLEVARTALELGTKLAAPILLASLAVGILVSLFQVVTQIQEQTLTFVPKLAAAGFIILLGGNWMMRELTTWVTWLWSAIPTWT